MRERTAEAQSAWIQQVILFEQVTGIRQLTLPESYSTFDRGDLDEMNELTPTPPGPADEIMDAINRVRVDGKAVVRTERTMDQGKPFYQLHYPFAKQTASPAGPGRSAWR